MTGQRAAAEPYATRFETEVTSIDGRRVWLERSHFYRLSRASASGLDPEGEARPAKGINLLSLSYRRLTTVTWVKDRNPKRSFGGLEMRLLSTPCDGR